MDFWKKLDFLLSAISLLVLFCFQDVGGGMMHHHKMKMMKMMMNNHHENNKGVTIGFKAVKIPVPIPVAMPVMQQPQMKAKPWKSKKSMMMQMMKMHMHMKMMKMHMKMNMKAMKAKQKCKKPCMKAMQCAAECPEPACPSADPCGMPSDCPSMMNGGWPAPEMMNGGWPEPEMMNGGWPPMMMNMCPPCNREMEDRPEDWESDYYDQEMEEEQGAWDTKLVPVYAQAEDTSSRRGDNLDDIPHDYHLHLLQRPSEVPLSNTHNNHFLAPLKSFEYDFDY